MIFEELRDGYWPVDETAHAAMEHFGFLAPLDKYSFNALQKMIGEGNNLEVIYV